MKGHTNEVIEMSKKQIGLRIDEVLHNQLVRLSEATGVSQTRIVENALRAYVIPLLTGLADSATLPTT